MLANGATLEYKKKGESSFRDLPGLREIPEIGVSAEKVDRTTLKDKQKAYEKGIGDPGELTYKFLYDNTDAESPYRQLRALEDSQEVVDWKETLADGTTTEYKGQASVKRTGGGVNGLIEFNLSIAVQSEFKITDPE